MLDVVGPFPKSSFLGRSFLRPENITVWVHCPVTATTRLILEKLIDFITHMPSGQILDTVSVHLCGAKLNKLKKPVQHIHLIAIKRTLRRLCAKPIYQKSTHVVDELHFFRIVAGVRSA